MRLGTEKKDVRRSESLTIEVLSIPPTINTAYSRGSHGKRFLSKKGKAFKSEVEIAAKKFYGTLGRSYYRLTIIVQCRWLTKDGRVLKKDISNRIKIAEDGIAKALGVDDARFFEVRALKSHSYTEERTVFYLEPVEEKDERSFGIDTNHLHEHIAAD